MDRLDLFNLSGKRAIVTGAYAGLGRGMAEALVEAEAKVVIIDVNPSINITAKDIGAGCVCTDLTDRDILEEKFEEAVNLLGGVDILVNSAGVNFRHPFDEIRSEDWDRVIEINLRSVFAMCQLAIRKMLPQGYGKIINIASMLSFFGGYMVSPYSTSKGAIMQLTKALSNEYMGRGIRVNAIAPGYMDTPMNSNLITNEMRYKEITERIPIGKWGGPEDIKGAVVFLASAASDYISGVILPVDGGFAAR